MEWYEDEVRGLELAHRRGFDGPPPVAFFGSSSIRLWSTLAEDFPEGPVVNLGFGGSTLEACAHFFDRLVPPVRPRSLVLYAGDNDLGDGRSPDDVLASLADLLRRVDATLGAAPVAFVSIKPSPAREYLDAQIRRANDLARRAMAERPSGLFVDVHARMLDPLGRPRRELYDDDGLHLSRAGYRLWAGAIREFSPILF